MATPKRPPPFLPFALGLGLLAAAIAVSSGGTGKLRVMLIEETEARQSLPANQRLILTSKVVRDYLDTHCVVEDGTPAYRFLDPNDDVSRLSKADQEIFQRPRKSVPWLTLTNGSRYFDGPLPDVPPAKFVVWLQQYGGP